MLNIRIHGRGGQGVVTASKILGMAAYLAGKQVRTFPLYGAERRGAPVTAFIRIDEAEIHLKSLIYHPDCIMVIDSRLPYVIHPFQGLKSGGTVILNSRLHPQEARAKLGLKNIEGIAVVKATDIAEEVLGTPITNIVMLGAFPKMYGFISLDSIKQGIRTVFGKGERGDRQIQAAEIGYQNTEIAHSS